MTAKTYTVKFYIYDVRHKHKVPSPLLYSHTSAHAGVD